MPRNNDRWTDRLAAELHTEQAQAPRPPSVRKGRLARRKRRAALEAAGLVNPSQTLTSAPPSGTPGKPL
jgi:hypothetical protein